MPTLATTHPTLLDVTTRLDPDGSIARIAEMMAQTNEVLDDAVWLEGNLPIGHVHTIRTGLPTPTWRKLYGFVQPTKSRTVQVQDTCGMLEDYAEVDKALADLNGNAAAFRLSEDRSHIEGIAQELAGSLLYANEATAPEEITGLAPRFNDLSAENAENIIKVGTTPNHSIWLTVWGPDTLFCMYPKGSKAGLKMQDLGEVTVTNSSGGMMQAYRTHYRHDAGLCLRDWRFVVRAQIDYSELVKNAATGPDLTDIMVQMLERLPTGALGRGRPAFYVGKGVRSMLRRQIVNKTANSTLSQDNMAGKSVITFDGVPVRRVDQLLYNETAIS